MIAKLKRLLRSQTQTMSAEERAHSLDLAAASLLLEVVYADEHLCPGEADLLPRMMASTLSLAEDEIALLLEEAKQAHHHATSLFEFTTQINAEFDLQQKQELILAMWRLAYADGNLCRYEDQIIRRTADLLYLKHSELMQMRNLAIEGGQT